MVRNHITLSQDGVSPSFVSQLLRVDISDRARPTLRDQVTFKGEARESQLVQGGSASRLHVVVTDTGEMATSLRTFTVSDDALEETPPLELGPSETITRFTADYLISAHIDKTNRRSSRLSLIDLTTSAVAGQLTAQAIVTSPSQLDMRSDMLRVLSISDNQGIVEVFDIRERERINRVSECSFVHVPTRDNAAVFTDGVVFIASASTAPASINVVAIDQAGRCELRTGLAVQSGATLKTAAADERLLAVRRVDARTLEVSLYAVDEAESMIARKNATGDEQFSTVYYHSDRAAVVEQAVNVEALDGTPETGLLIVPFTALPGSVQGMQFFSFSDRSLTRRGHAFIGTILSHVLSPAPDLAASLTPTRFGVHEVSMNAGEPAEARGQLDLVANDSSVFVYGDHVVRAQTRSSVSDFVPFAKRPSARVEVLDTTIPVEQANVVATVEVPLDARLRQVGQLLVSLTPLDLTAQLGWRELINTQIDVYDLSDPRHPSQRATFTTERLAPVGAGHLLFDLPGNAGLDTFLPCTDCRDDFGNHVEGIYVLGSALVFSDRIQNNDSSSFRLQVLDLSDPEQPELLEPIELPAEDRATSILAADDTLYISYQRPVASSDETPLIKRYLRTFKLEDPQTPKLSDEINIPGELLAVDGDALITRDRVWNDGAIEAITAQLELTKRGATLTALHSVDSRGIVGARADGAGHVLLLTDSGQRWDSTQLTVLNSDGLTVESELTVDSLGTLTQLAPGKVLLSRVYERTVLDTSDPRNVHATLHLETTQSDHSLAKHGDRWLIATGLLGIQTLQVQ